MCGFLFGWKYFFVPKRPIDMGLAAIGKNIFEPEIAGNPDGSLRVYAMNVVGLPAFKSPSPGFGVYLGQGLVLTTGHVVGRYPFAASPHVLIGGKDLPAKVIKIDSPEQTDLAVLAVDQRQLPASVQLRRITLCKTAIAVGTNVIVVNPVTTVRSRVVSPMVIAPQFRTKFTTLISDAYSMGSAVFHADKKCLLGIVTREIPKYAYGNKSGRETFASNGYAGYFVPTSLIVDLSPGIFDSN